MTTRAGRSAPAVAAGMAALLAGVLAAGAQAVPHRAGAAPDSIVLRETIQWLADPAREGRGVGTAGLDSSAAYLERHMKAMGLHPAGDDGTWRQSFEVTTGVVVEFPAGVVAGSERVAPGDDFQPLGFSTNGTLCAPVVFAGYGITAPGSDWDDYTGIDVRDKIVLVLSHEPGEYDSTSRFDGTADTPYSELRTKAIAAREHGALGLLVVNGPRHHAGEPPRAPRNERTGYMSSGLLAAQVSERIADALLRSRGITLAVAQQAIEEGGRPRSFALPESATVTVTLRRTRAAIANVVGMIPGRDTMRTLVIGAHYDHLGYGGESALDNLHVPHVGADDNASGTAALLEVARGFATRHARGWTPVHTLVFASFTGEESGVLGSGHLVEDPPRPMSTVEAMINMDMVGRLKDEKLMVMGTGTAEGLADLVTRTNAAVRVPFTIKPSSDGYGPSDHSSFYKKQVPVLMLFTGAHGDYHKPSDTWDKIQYSGLARVAGFATALMDSLDARPRLAWRRAEADTSASRASAGRGYGSSYLGTIPDFSQSEGGVLLSGVREKSPAEAAGLRQGDVLIRFDGVRIDNLYDYTYALRSRKPGQQVRVTIKRGAEEVEIVATLGKRPS